MRKNIGLFLLLVLLITIVLFLSIGVLSNADLAIHQPTEKPIASKYSTNGSYFGPTHFVVSEDGTPSRVSTRHMYNLDIGDTYTVHGQLTMYDLLILALIIFIFVPILLWLMWIITLEVFGDNRWITWLRGHLTKLIKRLEAKVIIKWISVLVVGISLVCFLLIGKNTFHKLMPSGKTLTTATIIDREEELLISSYTLTRRYSFTLHYNDEAGKDYHTVKDVSHVTYNHYKDDTRIPLAYRDKRPYDVFVVSRSFREYVSSIFRLETGLSAVVLYLNYFIIRKYRHSFALRLPNKVSKPR